MVFYAAKIMRDPADGEPDARLHHRPQRPRRPTLRRDVLPATILPETAGPGRRPRSTCASCSSRASGGIIFTTIQKFAPEEKGDTQPGAHRSAQRRRRRRRGTPLAVRLRRDSRLAGRLKAGLAKHLRDALPDATCLGFTGTPIETTDKSTRAVFGDYIDIYDLTRAVEDGATVRIFYESRLAKVELDEASR